VALILIVGLFQASRSFTDKKTNNYPNEGDSKRNAGVLNQI